MNIFLSFLNYMYHLCTLEDFINPLLLDIVNSGMFWSVLCRNQ